jgi:hypothetical protein
MVRAVDAVLSKVARPGHRGVGVGADTDGEAVTMRAVAEILTHATAAKKERRFAEALALLELLLAVELPPTGALLLASDCSTADRTLRIDRFSGALSPPRGAPARGSSEESERGAGGPPSGQARSAKARGAHRSR